MRLRSFAELLLPIFLLSACGGSPVEQEVWEPVPSSSESEVPTIDGAILETILGVTAVEEDGRFKVAFPQDDLDVSVDGFRIIPPMGLTSWTTFSPAPGGAVVMGDFVLRESEIAHVEQVIIESGLTVSALHNHFVRDEPKVMFMHIHGHGDLEELAQGVHRTRNVIGELRQADGLQEQSAVSVETSFEPSNIDAVLAHSGTMNSGVYKVTIGRPDVELTDRGASVNSFMGFNTWMAFQGTPERAAVCGDFAMLEEEVAPVIEALVRNDIEVVALHNHMVTEEPRIFFLHFWGVGSVESLAEGLKTGLEATGNP